MTSHWEQRDVDTALDNRENNGNNDEIESGIYEVFDRENGFSTSFGHR